MIGDDVEFGGKMAAIAKPSPPPYIAAQFPIAEAEFLYDRDIANATL